MCGCMLMHATMNHGEQQHTSQTGSTPLAPAPNTKCAYCGFPMQQSYAFCPSCGMSLRTANCSACGQKVDPAWVACAYCGSPLGETLKVEAHH